MPTGLERIIDGKEEKEFSLVPIYVYQLKEKEPPKKYIKGDKDEEEWPELGENHEFIMSLYPGDLVEIKMKGQPAELYHYVSTHRRRNCLKTHSNKKKGKDFEISLYLQTNTETIRRFNMDMLGGRYLVKEEERTWPGEQPT